MARVLLLFAHPALEKSRINARLIRDVGQLDGITFHDLYEAYPDFFVDVAAEQQLLAAHDTIVLHHPMFWYSSPALVKQWADLVLEHGWAYGAKGTALRGKQLVHVVTTGGGEQAYQTAGMHQHTIREFLLPFEQTAKLCGMLYLPPYLVHGTHRLADHEIESFAQEYLELLQRLRDGHFDMASWLHGESGKQFLQQMRK
ncbi:NAD(P)H-dependent oxidoreductase [candidate division KSB1 bacterium]|nr:NAD(P)H-dependent oxidoreductase [bacterium]NUM68622.1 NAD(P)H-dependent oxidoreductase [candidate division KSB1 bacterium]